jgi:hypothetical protein
LPGLRQAELQKAAHSGRLSTQRQWLVRNRFQRWLGRRTDASGVHRGRRSFARHACYASFIGQHADGISFCIFHGIDQLRAFMCLSLTPVRIDFSPTDCTS